MIGRLPRRFGLGSGGRDDRLPAASEPAPRPVPPTRVELVVYADDCVGSGWIALDDDRLTDLLNGHDEFELVDVRVESLEDGHAVEVHHLVIARDELYAVRIGGPRGNPERRTQTRAFPVSLKVGRYTVWGYLHALPGDDPIAGFRRRPAMVPLTDAWIEYDAADGRRRMRVGTLVVNRELTEWIVPAVDEDIKRPDIEMSSHLGRLAQDVTGQIKSS